MKSVPNSEKWMCAGRQALRWLRQGYGPGLDRREVVPAVVVGEAAPHAGEVRVERRGVLVALVDVAPGGVGLPDLDQLTAHRSTVAVQDAAGDPHPLAHGLPRVLHGQVGLHPGEVALAEHRRPELDALGVGLLEALGRVAQQAAAVGRVVPPGLRLPGGVGHRAVDVRLRDRRDLRVDLGLGRRLAVGVDGLRLRPRPGVGLELGHVSTVRRRVAPRHPRTSAQRKTAVAEVLSTRRTVERRS